MTDHTPGTTTAELRALLDKATRRDHGPWEHEHGRVSVCDDPEAPRGYPTHSDLPRDDDDCAVIAALRNVAPELLRVVEAVAATSQADLCCFCRALNADEDEHTKDCAWVLARKLTGSTEGR